MGFFKSFLNLSGEVASGLADEVDKGFDSISKKMDDAAAAMDEHAKNLESERLKLAPGEEEYVRELTDIYASNGLLDRKNSFLDLFASYSISERDKRFLEKIKKANNIRDSRAEELEFFVLNKKFDKPSDSAYTAEEQEYMKEFKDIISEGGISERDRRFLEKIKETNGISDTRALELEAAIRALVI